MVNNYTFCKGHRLKVNDKNIRVLINFLYRSEFKLCI